METRLLPEHCALDLGRTATRRVSIRRTGVAAAPESPPPSDEPIAVPGRAERIAQRVHALCGQGADLEFLITVLIGEVESSMDLLTAVLRHCTRRVPGDPEWQRATTAVQVTMGTGLLRWT